MHRDLPDWFDAAKFGIFIHWTAASVPAFAPVNDSPFDLAAAGGWELAFRSSPYVEWYQNSLAIEGSPVAEHHHATYGDLPYEAFVEQFRAGHAGWRPDLWADLFAAAGAKYVVLVTKHHDGVLLWPSSTPNPFRDDWASERDLVGELATAVRDRGLRFGTYYSGGLDWTFGGLPITDMESMIGAIPQTDEYLEYANTHWRELIERYEPCVMWNDIGYPRAADLEGLFEWYYDRVPDGLVNNRFDFVRQGTGEIHADFVTPEYSTAEDPDRKWEVCRGIGTSFGYNRFESPDDYQSADDAVRLLVDIVARGGNLLLNVGPTGLGRIPWIQADRLMAIGHWLAANGEAIYCARPGTPTSATTPDGLDVRFTRTDEATYAIVLGTPKGDTIVIPEFDVTAVRMLGHDADLPCVTTDAGLRVTLPELLDDAPAFTIRGVRR